MSNWAPRGCIIAYIVLSLVVILRLALESSLVAYGIFPEITGVVKLRGSKKSKIPLAKTPQNNFSVPLDNVYYEKMTDAGAHRSMGHLRKFLARKDQVPALFNSTDRYQPVVKKYASVIVSEQFAFLHVWKCGGTTVEEATLQDQLPLSDERIQQRQWLALVRDPIDRFLSAWAECGVRLYEGTINFKGNEKMSSLNWLEEEYDFRVRAWLREVNDYLPPARSCHTHAFPQANFMLNETGYIDHRLSYVGDLTEMRASLQIAGLKLGPEEVVGRDSSEDIVKNFYFQSNRHLLTEDTLLDLCRFFAIDYFLFDFVPPKVCVQEGGPLANMDQPSMHFRGSAVER